MTADQSRRLELAYRAWRATQPSEADVRAGVLRLERARRRQRRGRAGLLRRTALAAVTVVLLAALAYAATISPLSTPSRVEQQSQQTLPSVADNRTTTEPPARNRIKSGAQAPEIAAVSAAQQADPGKKRSASLQGAATKQQTAPEPPSWREVDDALARGDDAHAQKMLERLADNPRTSAKARLGLAQLALGRGDCETARNWALAVTRDRSQDESSVRRAHDILIRCDK